jgi:D-threo-aldose 1-dehydrogenase
MVEFGEVTRMLPNGKPISRLGFGCSSLWAKSSFAQDAAIQILWEATARGINHFDTAPSYALGEDRLGAFLKEHGDKDLVVSTKVGTERETGQRSFARDRMRASFEESLRRLCVSRVDILYLHGPTLADLNDETFSFFEDLKQEGLIDYAGVNSFDPAVISFCLDSAIDAFMLQYNLLDRRFDDLIEKLSQRSKITMAGTILAQSIFDMKTFKIWEKGGLWYLARAFKNDPSFFIRGRKLAKQISKSGIPPHEFAIRFNLANTAITSNLFGTRSVNHLADNVNAAHSPLERDLVQSVLRNLPEKSQASII